MRVETAHDTVGSGGDLGSFALRALFGATASWKRLFSEYEKTTGGRRWKGTHHETDGRVRFRLVWTDPASVQVSESVSQSVSPCVDCEA